MSTIKIRRLGWGLPMVVGLVLVLIFVLTALVVADTMSNGSQGRSDVIVIDVLKTHGPLERPPVTFYHDKHTEALTKQNKDCLACHALEKERLQPAFGRNDQMSKQTIMETFHDRCITCHSESGTPGKDSGPVTCGACHVKDTVPETSWVPIDLDKSLHYRHVKATDEKCEQCHHQYDEKSKKLVYVKGQEGACLYCHKEQAEENRISTQAASHLACVGCHRQLSAQSKDAGPVQCAGCHDPKQQALIERPVDIPRMKRNQPDVVLVKIGPADQQNSGEPAQRMPAVAFDHKAHEGYNATCKGCHHADLQSCAQCHTVQGDVDAKQVKLAQAMHQQDTSMSCVGCHNLQKEQPQCIGCHHSIPQARTIAAQSTCQTCHLAPIEGSGESGANPPMDKNQSAALASRLLAERPVVRHTVAADQIPESVTIKSLARDFKPVKLPHRRIVLALAKANQDSELAANFHKDPLTLCQGCHHNSPASLKPPQCGSCHGRSSEALNLTRPGLMAAYHQQCIECHESMGLEKPVSRDCTACHAKRR